MKRRQDDCSSSYALLGVMSLHRCLVSIEKQFLLLCGRILALLQRVIQVECRIETLRIPGLHTTWIP
jgi:hypothetical protein